jgi:hypothetical protein
MGVGAPMAISLDELQGWWKLMNAWHEFDTSELRYPYGRSAVGSLVFTDDSRMMSVIIADRDTAHPAGYDMEAYSGRFALEGSEMITTVDVSSRLEWRNSNLRHFLSLSHDDFLCVTSTRQISSLYSGVPFTAAFRWFRMRR